NADVISRLDVGVVAVHLDERIVSLVVLGSRPVRAMDVDAPKLLVRVALGARLLVTHDYRHGDDLVLRQTMRQEPGLVSGDRLHESLYCAVWSDLGNPHRRLMPVARQERGVLRKQR